MSKEKIAQYLAMLKWQMNVAQCGYHIMTIISQVYANSDAASLAAPTKTVHPDPPYP